MNRLLSLGVGVEFTLVIGGSSLLLLGLMGACAEAGYNHRGHGEA
ncbi:MAG: hypothetical protein RMJ84_07380 [Sandaracinaceae bacterium]|nr:hypothetical protein [Sandaracinaceae bacterium]